MSARTLTLQEVVEQLARQVGCSEEMASDFIREFSTAATQGLASEGVVTLSGIGIFRVVTDMDNNPTVEYAPAHTMAEIINAPFAIFEPVELADAVTEESFAPAPDVAPTPPPVPEKFQTKTVTAQTGQAAQAAEAAEVLQPAQPLAAAALEDGSPARVPQPAETAEVPQPAQPVQVSQTSQPGQHLAAAALEDGSPARIPQPAQTAEVSQPAQDPQIQQGEEGLREPVAVVLEPESKVTVRRVGHTTLTLFFAGIACLLLGILIGSIIGYNFYDSLLDSEYESVEVYNGDEGESLQVEEVIESDEPTDSVTDIETEEATTITEEPVVAKVVTDTVAPGNFLSRMAKKHYGNSKFWVYIYLENKDKIKNPDSLENGLILVIPPPEKYGIDPNSKESLDKAQREGAKALQ